MKRLSFFILFLITFNVKSQSFKCEYKTKELIYYSGLKGQTVNDSLTVTPNPFVKHTCVFYGFQYNDTVTIKVLNLVGQTILTLFTDSIMFSGNYQDSLKMDALADGIYFLQLKLGHRKSLNKKIIKTSTAGIKENMYISEVNIYPNPVTNVLTITNGQNQFENSEIEIINSSGQTVLKSPFSNQLNVSEISTGTYILKIKTTIQIYYSKFVKQ